MSVRFPSPGGPSPTVLIGLDGATFSVLDPLMQANVMPFLKKFAAGGVRGVLHSTVPALTPPAWTTLMTGRSPGNHGIFDFVRVNSQSDPPGYTLTTSADNRCETLWSVASRNGCRVTTLNFPCMFPPQPIDGFVVPGFVPWSYLPRAVYPRDLYAAMKAQPGFNARELALDFEIERKALQGLPEEEFDEWIRFHIGREQQWFEIVKYLMREEPCDLTAVLFDGVDKLQHLCYHLLEPSLAARATSNLADPAKGAWAKMMRDLCLEYFRQLDSFIEQIVAMAGAEARVFITSDHGFCAAEDQIFYANVWLQQNGYLAWRDEVEMDEAGHVTLEGFTETGTLFDWKRTRAFAMTASSNAIFIRRGRAGGTAGVSDDAHDEAHDDAHDEAHFEMRARLIDELLAFCDPRTGRRVIERIYTREEAFAGSQMDDAPDLTLVLRDRSLLSVLRADAPLKPRPLPYGTHHPHGVFLARGEGIRQGATLAPLSLVDIMPTLLYSLGLPIPGDLEGMCAASAFEPELVAARPIRSSKPDLRRQEAAVAEPQQGMDEAGERHILERLKALGYLE